MFTGLIEATGVVTANVFQGAGKRLTIQSSFTELAEGESIAVNGVCLTRLPAASFGAALQFDVSPETLQCTNLATLKPGDSVNLERAMLATSRLGGHYVSGHVDTTATISAKHAVGEFIELTVGPFTPQERKFLLPKGSICLDGVSLTINAVEKDDISLLLVPHTLAKTTLATKQADDCLNVEFDYLARVVAHQLACAGDPY